MLPVEHQSYVPALRLKQGEYMAFTEITNDVAVRLLPHLLPPPPDEYDPEKGRILSVDEIVYENGSRIGRYWPRRPSLVDPRFLFPKLGEKESSIWLPRLFEVARNFEARPIPVAALSDLECDRLNGFQRAIDGQAVGAAIRLTLRDLGDEKLLSRLHSSLLKVVALPSQCLLILDLAGADLSNVEAVGDYIVTAFQRVCEIGRWRRVIVEATSFPAVNSAKEDSEVLLPRNEWKAWQWAVESDEMVRQHVMFGDFGADSAKFVFSSGAIAPIRHYRYSTQDHWLVVRGNRSADVRTTMKSVAGRIVRSEQFAGQTFSRGDRYIFEMAHDVAGPGNPSTWRKVNTVHHLTRVSNDLGPVHGYEISRLGAVSPGIQADLFEGLGPT